MLSAACALLLLAALILAIIGGMHAERNVGRDSFFCVSAFVFAAFALYLARAF